MCGAFSIYPNLLRVVAASFVLSFHLEKRQLGPKRILRLIPDSGHDVVVSGYVLPGHVIAPPIDKNQALGFRKHLLAQGSRAYSVARTVLLLSAGPALFTLSLLRVWQPHIQDESAATTTVNLLYVRQAWGWKIQALTERPYWALCSNGIYWLGLCVFVYASGWTRWLGLLAIALVSGATLLLLLPGWLARVLLNDKNPPVLGSVFVPTACHLLSMVTEQKRHVLLDLIEGSPQKKTVLTAIAGN